jgi:hypothetical protein
MAGKLRRALHRMTGPSSMSWWRPQGDDPIVAIPAIEALSADDELAVREGSSTDLGDRQRELAFDMYAEALMRIADEDDAVHRRKRRASA